MAAFKTHNFLPEVFRTDTNQKFLNATLDQLTSEPNFKKVSGYIGRKFAPTFKTGDGYVTEPTASRQHYQVEPGVVVNNPSADTTDFYASYPDLINKLSYYGANVTNHSRLFGNDVYSYSGLIDLDKFVNFSQYYWLPNGPDAVTVSGSGIPLEYTYDVNLNTGNSAYYLGNNSNTNSEITLAYGGVYKFNVGTTGSLWIQTQPGITGHDPQRPNIGTRNVYGVENNGADAGTVIFRVPQVDTQNKFLAMPTVASVDYATTLTYADMQAVKLSDFNAKFGGLDGITGNIHNKTLIFVRSVYDDIDWTATTTRVSALDNTGSDFMLGVDGVHLPWIFAAPLGDAVVETARTSTWLVSVDEDGYINLSPQTAVALDEKVYVKSGTTNSTKEFYINYYKQYEVVPLATATLDTLYYQNGTIPTAVGTIKLVHAVTDILDPAITIEGKKSYTSPNRIELTNGLKITFDNSVTAAYADKSFYVTGVGKSIKLVAVTDMIAVETWANSTVVGTRSGTGYSVNDILTVVGGEFVAQAKIQVTEVNGVGAIAKFKIVSGGEYKVLPTNPVTVTGGSGTDAQFNLTLQPVAHDYLTINRASADMNAWSRSNRWFHVDIIKRVAAINGTELLLDQNATAKRPIIEIEQNVKLFNNGTVAKAPIDVLDTVITNAYTQVESVPALNSELLIAHVGGNTVTLRHGDRVIFSNDTNSSVREKIYNFSIVDVSNDPFSPVYIGSITEAKDAAISTGHAVVIRNTDSAEKEFWYNGQQWIPAQQKLSVNQAPLFDVYDSNSISFGDTTYYTNTSFIGTPIFSYKTGSGTKDTVLGFPLSYRSFNNVGDIQFTNNFDSESFTYLIGPVTHTLPINNGLIRITKDADNFDVTNSWVVTTEATKQYQLISHTADGINNVFEVDILPEANDTIPNIKVLVNSKLVPAGMFGMTQIGIRYAVVIDASLLAKDSVVDILIYSTGISKMGFYQVPSNLDNNAENANFSTLTLGQMRNHLVTLYHNSLDVVGAVPGESNLRDLNIKLQGGSILKHSAPVLYSELFLVDQQMNFIDAIKLAQREYAKFKNRYLELASNMEVDLEDLPATADAIIKQINGIKNSTFPWYYSDMVPQGDAKTVLPDYVILDPRVKKYQLTQKFDDTVLSNKAVLVYMTRTADGKTTKSLLAKDRDYSFDTDSSSFTIADTFNLNYNDILSVVEYSTTDGNFVPETPSKLGLYPKFVPSMYLDDTYLTPVNVIQGHDGSLTPAFNDYRDDLLLELELRIYNNIKAKFDINMHSSHTPGKFRNTDYSLFEYTQVLTNSFLSWAGANRLDFATNKFFKNNDPWTWNYKNFRDTIDGEFLPGGWRAIFMYLYDTMRPHTHPWEMLGFSAKPSWWNDRYGPAPYTGGNLTLWTDLSLGYIHAGERAGIDPMYARPGLLSIIPVDESGKLLSPEKYAVLDFDSLKANASFAVGDIGPAEAAWRKSSDYAFAVQIAMALTKPAKYFGLYANVDRYNMNTGLMQYVNSISNQHITPTSIAVNGDTGDGSVIRTAGYVNWIADYLKNLGIGDPQAKIRAALKNVSVQLNYKVAGYTDKKFLKILAEQGSPSSTNNSIVIPDENYRIILNKSAPVDRIVYSAVIVERSANGYTVSGYDLNNPYFSIIPSQQTNNAYSIKTGKATAVIYKDYLPLISKFSYGHEFNNTQQVVDFLVSYQRYLQSQGFIFVDNDNDLGAKKDWILSAKEFLTWAQQGWAPGNVLVLSPVNDKVRVTVSDAVVDEITNTPGGSKILDPNFAVIKSQGFTVVRSNNDFTVTSTTGKTIALAELNIVQYEHVIIFDNTTVFNDIIYSADTGNRQYRLKFVGYKTANWTGAMNPPGFIYNSTVYEEWQSGKDYRKGQLVVYKNLYYTALENVAASTDFDTAIWKQIDQSQLKTGLLPNFANNAKAFESMYDIDNQPFNDNINFYSNGLTGFRERGYLTDLLLDAETQVKFYQGYIKQKGTSSAVTALSAAEINGSPTSINVYEEWALRVGEYGATDSNQYAEVILDDLVITSNPAAIQMLESNAEAEVGATAYYPADLYRASKNNVPAMFDFYQTSADKTTLPIAGYPRVDDVNATIFDFANYRDLSASLKDIGTGYTIWTAKDFDGKWNVYRVSETGTQVTALSYNMDNIATVTTNNPHNLATGDIIAIKGFGINVNDVLTTYDGFYQVYDTVDSLNFTIVLTTGYAVLQKAKVIRDSAILFKLSSSRLSDVGKIADATPMYGWTANDNIWVDNASSNGWGVYRRSEPWGYLDTAVLNISEYTHNDLFGATVKSSKSKQFIYVGAPGNGAGRVASFVRQSTGDYVENASWVQHSSYTNGSTGVQGFGGTLDLNDRALIVGASQSNTNTGQVYIYKIENGVGIEVKQAIASPNANTYFSFGHSICSSSDGNWLYISEPGANKVYVYNWVPRTVNYPALTITSRTVGPFALNEISNAEDILVTGTDVYIPYIDYTVSGPFITFAAPLAEDVIISYNDGYRYHDTLTGSDTAAGDNFGISVSCDELGRTLAVGANNKSGSGAMYIFDRSVENFVSFGNSNTFAALRSIDARYKVLLDNVEQLLTAEYVQYSNTVQFLATPQAGSIITIENNHFTEIAKVVSATSVDAQQLGTVVTMCADASSIYAGAPTYSTMNYNSGAVYKFTNPAKLYGTITGKTVNPVLTPGHGIRINNVDVILTGTTIDSAIDTINSFGIPGISASNVGGKLKISSSAIGVDTFNVLPGVGTAFADLGIELYPQAQIILHPKSNANEFFGAGIKISEDEHTLAVTSFGATTLEHISFDQLATVFDSGSTAFSHAVPNSGAVYVFDLIDNATATVDNPSLFEFTQSLQPAVMLSDMKFGAAIEIMGKSIFVGAPGSDVTSNGAVVVPAGGVVMEFFNTNNYKGWQLVRSETPQVDYASIAKAFIYNKNTKNIITHLDIFDPAKGKILGVADQDIDYKSELDPAIYNGSASADYVAQSGYSPEFHWSNAQVGKTWWDLSQVRYINYEQGSLDYKNKHWGATFPGSVFKVYEWVESDSLPSQYVANGGNGIPKYTNNEYYITHMYVDPSTNIIKTKYYFWVSDKTTVDVNLTNRTNSVYTIQQILANPKDQGIPYMSAIAANAASLFNVTEHLVGQAVVLHIDHTPVQNTNIIHTEYELVKENADSAIPKRIVDKLQDSLVGINFAGHTVPDPALGVADRYGIEIRPRQTMFVDRNTALANFVKYINSVFAQHPITNLRDLNKLKNGEPKPAAGTGVYDKVLDTKNELSYIISTSLPDGYKVLISVDTDYDGLWTIYEWQAATSEWVLVRIQSYLTSLYFEYIDWYDPSYDKTAKTTYTVANYPLVSKLSLVAGNTVKVLDDGNGKFAIYRMSSTSNLDKVGAEDGTIQILPTLYNLEAGNMGFDNDNFDTIRFDQNPILETRDVFSAVVDDIFIADLQIEFNKLFFSLVNYIYTEQSSPDWIFKTSFLSVVHNIRELAQYPSYIKDNQTYYEDYINEVKPYRTIIREYLPTQSTTDYLHAGVTDFDLPSYYDETTGTYRSPSGEQYYDAERLATDTNYADWYNNHTYKVVEILVSNGGSGYTTTPIVTITGGGGTGAIVKADPPVDGKIVSVRVINPGSGYTSIPTVNINGNGEGAVLVSLLRNEFKANAASSYNTVRSIDTELKFDRVLDSNAKGYITSLTSVVQWEPNTEYFATLGKSEVTSVQQFLLQDENGQIFTAGTSSGGSAQLLISTATSGEMIWLESGTLVAYDGEIYLPVIPESTAAQVTVKDVWATGTGFTMVDSDFRIVEFVIPVSALHDIFDYTKFQKLDQGNVLITNNDRITGYYSPTVGMPGKSITQLVNGIEYPGVQVTGTTYADNVVQNAWTSNNGLFIEAQYNYQPIGTVELSYYDTVVTTTEHFDWVNLADNTNAVGIFQSTNDISMFTDPRIDWATGLYVSDGTAPWISSHKSNQIQLVKAAEETLLAKLGNQVDSTIASPYKDTLLGTRPEDILIDGGAYYDTFSAHAPEEMMPGRVYDTLDIQVLQANTPGFDTNVFTITSITVQDPGYGYTDAAALADDISKGIDVSGIQLVNVAINGINNANVTPVLAANGAITSFTINNGGQGLTSNANPVITITGSNIAMAQATAIISQNTYDLIGWRDFYDMNGQVSYTRILPKYTTTLARDLHVTDTEVYVDNIYVLSYPSIELDAPGRVFINGELITFYSYDEATMTLRQIRRAAEGTGAATVHKAGSYVVDAGGDQIIPETTFMPEIPDPGAPETFIGDNQTTVFTTSAITTNYPNSVKVMVAGKYVTNFVVTGLNPVQVTFVRIGVNPLTPGFINAAPMTGQEIIISAEVERIWENLLYSGVGSLTLNGMLWETLTMDGVNPQQDPALVAQGFSWDGGVPSNDYVATAEPPVGAITDGSGLMGATTVQARFIRGEI